MRRWLADEANQLLAIAVGVLLVFLVLLIAGGTRMALSARNPSACFLMSGCSRFAVATSWSAATADWCITWISACIADGCNTGPPVRRG